MATKAQLGGFFPKFYRRITQADELTRSHFKKRERQKTPVFSLSLPASLSVSLFALL